MSAKILIVDDSATIRHQLRDCLEGALMAILPREERLKRAAATERVQWSHVRGCAQARGPSCSVCVFISQE